MLESVTGSGTSHAGESTDLKVFGNPQSNMKGHIMNDSNRSYGSPLISHSVSSHGTRAPGLRVKRAHEARGNEAFQPLPPPPGNAPFHITLESVLGKKKIDAIKKAGKLIFHSVGDTGGIKDAVPQTIVVKKMVEQLGVPEPDCPAFFYHLGDVVYFKGEAAEYFPQFYEAYENYAAPILAIPGNHDGTPPGDGRAPLRGGLGTREQGTRAGGSPSCVVVFDGATATEPANLTGSEPPLAAAGTARSRPR